MQQGVSCIVVTLVQCAGCHYSGNSHNGLSEIWTVSLQRTSHVTPNCFAVEIIHFQDEQPPISGQQMKHMPPKDK